MFKKIIKKIIPGRFIFFYHVTLALLAKIFYGNPSAKILLIGVTGTVGKSSTCYFLAQILEQCGLRVGMTTTTLFKISSREWLNDQKMTMLGRFQTQKMIAQMVRAGCDVAIIETSSQGVSQSRHLGVNYDFLIFTNLYPEHIEAHGSFDKYRAAKGKLFRHLTDMPRKKISVIKKESLKNKLSALSVAQNLNNHLPKVIIGNIDDEHYGYFFNFPADLKISFGVADKADFPLRDLKINLLGEYNKLNALAGFALASQLGLPETKIKDALKNLKALPGRLEFIENNLGIHILVDYAFEPGALKKVYETIDNLHYGRLVHILGSTGGTADKAMQRDKSRRPILGRMAAEKADVIIVTNEDPYDENPKEIIAQVVAGAMGRDFVFPFTDFLTILKFVHPVSKKEIYAILDRREAIGYALGIAQKNDLILITGKGAEQAMCLQDGLMVRWDDRQVVREELSRLP